MEVASPKITRNLQYSRSEDKLFLHFFTLRSLGDFCSNLSSIFWRHSELGLDELPLPTYIFISLSALSLSPSSLSPLIPISIHPSPHIPLPFLSLSHIMSPLILLPSFLSSPPNAPIISSLSFHIPLPIHPSPNSSLSQIIPVPTFPLPSLHSFLSSLSSL